jgi:hypothetical protein
MRNVNLRVRTVLLVSFLSICLVACTGPVTKKEDIQGKWMAAAREPGIPGRSGQVGFVIEFFSDNTVMFPSGKRTWSILDDGRIKIDDPGIIMQGLLKEDVLTITMPNDVKIVFKKQK